MDGEAELDNVAELTTVQCGVMAKDNGKEAVVLGFTGTYKPELADAIGTTTTPICIHLAETPSHTSRVMYINEDELATCVTSIAEECISRGF